MYDADDNLVATSDLVSGKVYFSLDKPISIDRKANTRFTLKLKKADMTWLQNTNKKVNLAFLENWQSYQWFTTSIVVQGSGEFAPGILIERNKTIDEIHYLRDGQYQFDNMAQTNTALVGDDFIYGFDMSAGPGNGISLKEFRVDVSVYDSTKDSTWFYVLWNSFSLYINNNSIQDVEFYNKQGTCSVTPGNLITNQNNLAPAAGQTTSYCLRVVFSDDYAEWYNISANSSVNFKIKAESANIWYNDRITTKMNDISDDNSMYTYYQAVNLLTSLIRSDNAAIVLNLGTSNWFTDADVMGLPLDVWTISN